MIVTLRKLRNQYLIIYVQTKISMRAISLIIIMVLLASSVFAQTKEEKQAAKKAKKEAKVQQDKENTAILIEMVKSKKFVLEAYTLYSKAGESFNLSSNLNFVGFDGENSTIQFSFGQLSGWNGVGGVTLDGEITKMEVNENKNGVGFTINASVSNKGGGIVIMTFSVNSIGNARVDMQGFFGDRLSFQGNIISLEKTIVYKGTAIF